MVVRCSWLNGPRNPVGQLLFVGQIGPQPRHHALMKALLITWAADRREAACFDVGSACLRSRNNLLLLQAGVIDQAKHRFLKESGGTRGPAFGDLPLDHTLKFVGKLNDAHEDTSGGDHSIRN